MSKPSPSTQYKKNFAKLKPNETMKNSVTLPELPQAMKLKLSDNHFIKTRIFSDLAALKLKTDKESQSFYSKKLSSFEQKETSRSDQSLLLSTLGLVSNKSVRQLPKDISKLKEILSSVKSAERLSLGSPATREDTAVLADWLDQMLKTALSESNQDIESLCETALVIYEVCFHEIVRQVSVQCVQRGELINIVWKAYLGILEKALKISKALQTYQLSEYLAEKSEIHARYQSQLSSLQQEFDSVQGEIDRLKRIIKSREDESSFMALKEIKITEKMHILQQQYERCKRDLLCLQEDHRILKAKLFNSNVEFVENSQGIIEPRLVSIQKIRRKTENEISAIVNSDPLLSAQMVSEEKTENLLKNIERYEEFTKEMMNKVDFIDKSTETVAEYKEAEVQTEFIEAIFSRKASMIQLMKLKVENVMELPEELSDAKDSGDENEGLRKQQTENYLSQFQEKIDQVNQLLEKMKTNIQKNIPQSFQQDLLNNFYRSVSESINNMKSEQDKDNAQDEVFRRKDKKTKMLTFIQKNNKEAKKPTLDLMSILTQKVMNTPQHKLKSIVFKRMLLRMIGNFYDLKLKKVSEGERKQEMGQIIIENYYNRYGMPKVVEGRYFQLLASCVKYKSIKRVHLFGRFLKLFKDCSLDDLNFYIDSLASMKQTYLTESFEELKIPFDKALDWYKYSLPASFTDTDRLKLKIFIENYKQIDPVTRVPTIEVDAMLEYSIDLLQKQRYETTDFLKSIYEAGDLNQDGFLQFHEFQLLHRHIVPASFTELKCQEIFKEFSENFTGEDDEGVEALSFENFSHLNKKFAIFTPEKLGEFVRLRGERFYSNREALYVEELKESSKNIKKTLSEMRWRYFQARNLENREEMLGILDLVQQQIRQLKKPQAILIALRLMDQESKRACIIAALNGLMPKLAFNF